MGYDQWPFFWDELQLTCATSSGLDFFQKEGSIPTTLSANTAKDSAVAGFTLVDGLTAAREALGRLDLLRKTILHFSRESLHAKVKAFASRYREERFDLLIYKSLCHLYKDAPDSLRRQLADSISFRHYRLKYAEKHQEKLQRTDITKVSQESKQNFQLLASNRLAERERSQRDINMLSEEKLHNSRMIQYENKEGYPDFPPSATDEPTLYMPQTEIQQAVQQRPLTSPKSIVSAAPKATDNYPKAPTRKNKMGLECPHCSLLLLEHEKKYSGWM